ncbi:uncharacterized protein [Arachis hypogaea]|uniref:uncharacterized protein n=1 Tax=Arachis hypogaea TaxID=3818 RepID=UPI003B21D9D2
MAETTRDEDRTEKDSWKGGRNVILLEEAGISEVWVQFWSLPESFKTLEVEYKLGERLGTVLEVGKFQMRGRETRIVKAKINIDAARQVRDQLIVARPNKKEVEVALCYERLEKFCTYCAKLGHEVKNCHDLLKDTESDMVKEDDIGEWVKASQVGTRIYSEGERTFNNSTQNQNKTTQRKKKPILNCLLEEFVGMSMQEGKQSLTPQDTGNKAAPESPQLANSRTECMEVIIADQSNAKEDERQLMQFAIGQCLTTEKGRKWKRLARQGAGGSDTKSESKRRLMSGVAGGLVLAWKDSINVQIINSGEFFVAAEIKEVGSSEWDALSRGQIEGKEMVKERLDRYLVGMGWKLKFPNAVVHRLTESGSDHAPILMETEPQSWHSKRHFKYQERWCREEDVKRIVSEVWRMEVVGSVMFSLAQKLKDCRHRLVQWQKTHKANSRKEIEDLQAKLEELRVAGINGGEEVTSLEEKLELAYLKEESYWREKSRVKWLKEGDQNTRFFHQKFQSRVQRNRIWRLVGRYNEIVTKPKDIAKVAEDYFCDIFTSSCSANPNPYLEDLEPKVTASMNRRLQRSVTMDEVKRATFSVHAQSAPGDDGFTAKFFTFSGI